MHVDNTSLPLKKCYYKSSKHFFNTRMYLHVQDLNSRNLVKEKQTIAAGGN